jgi:hypothetical protein
MGMRTPNEITDYQEIMQRVSYADWFSDKIARSYMNSFLGRLSDPSSKQAVLSELNSALTVYSLLVYRVYPSSQDLQQAINSSKEHKENFQIISGWLSKNGGQERATSFVDAARSFSAQ